MEGSTRPTDHDLLIELNIKFTSFENATDRTWRDVNDKMSRILTQMDSKADKQTTVLLQEKIDSVEKRAQAIETDRLRESTQATTKRETVINLGNMGLKTWSLIAGAIGLLITIINAVK